MILKDCEIEKRLFPIRLFGIISDMNFKRFNRKIALVLALATVIGAASCSMPDPKHSGTPETTAEPASGAEGLFPLADKDYFVPFQDPKHSYCSLDIGLSTPVREQGAGGCYSYAAVTTMQTEYLKSKGELIDINPVDIINRIYSAPDPITGDMPSFDEEKYYIYNGIVTDLGGDMSKVVAGLCADPLNGYMISEANTLGCYNCGLDGLYEITEEDIKKAVKEYGAVCLGVNYKKDCKMVNGFYTQNHPDNINDCNHVATIIGWDDNFPQDCFSVPAYRDGAWLVQNSFGEIWGNSGYYWVSYDTPLPELYNCVVTKDYSSAVSYGRFPELLVFSPDAVEMIGRDMESTQITREDVMKCSNVEYASVYSKSGTLGAVGIWSDIPGMAYEIEILEGSFGKQLSTVKGTFKYAGYQTVKLDSPVSVKQFTVVVKTAGAAYFEGESRETKIYKILGFSEAHYEAKTEAGRSFVKAGGEWVDVTDPSVMSLMGLSDVPAYKNMKTPGDPCITVLFL